MNKKSVAILGATGMVGRRFAELLIDHPWFEIAMLVGSGTSVGETYESVWETKETALQEHYGKDIWNTRPFPSQLRDRRIHDFEDIFDSGVDFVFSSVPERAGESERALLDHDFMVFSNSPYGRFEACNPLVVAEVNRQEMRGKRFIKNPNCVTSGLVLILAPLEQSYGIEEIAITTYQSLSGRGDAKYAKDLVIGNVYPLHGSSERTEIYIAKEVKKILQKPTPLSVSCNRVGVQEGHYVDVRVKTTRAIRSEQEVIELFQSYNPLRDLDIPSNPESPLVVINEVGRPRPCQDAQHHGGIAVAVGNISVDDEVYSLRLTYVVNNLIRGAAGGAILNAETYFAACA